MELIVLALVIVCLVNSICLVRLMRRRAPTRTFSRPAPPDSEPCVLPLRDDRYPRPYDPPSDPPRG
jgi:hypothetical protein